MSISILTASSSRPVQTPSSSSTISPSPPSSAPSATSRYTLQSLLFIYSKETSQAFIDSLFPILCICLPNRTHTRSTRYHSTLQATSSLSDPNQKPSESTTSKPSNVSHPKPSLPHPHHPPTASLAPMILQPRQQPHNINTKSNSRVLIVEGSIILNMRPRDRCLSVRRRMGRLKCGMRFRAKL